MLRNFKLIILFAITFISPLSWAICNIPAEMRNAFKNGSPALNFRLRQEDSKQQGLLPGYATTLRTTLGFETAEFYHSVFDVELTDVAHFFGMHYNPGVNTYSRPQYTLIADPPGAGITQVKLSYLGIRDTEIVLGRQYINLDNQRFIGSNDFRQYPQSFDAISIDSGYINDFEFFYAYLIDVDTNNSNANAAASRQQLSSNLLNLDWTGFKYGGLGAYVYFVNNHTVNTNSNLTLGFRLLSPADLTATDNYAYLLEIARQRSSFNNPVSYTSYYLHCYISKTFKYFTTLVGFERLGGHASGNNKSFITPLGSVDYFNGLAQAFTTTPARGLQDLYVTLSGTTNEITAGITYHLFRLDTGPGPQFAGQEIDLYADFKITKQIDFSIAYANYGAKNSAALSTQRFWVMLTAYML